MAQELGNKRLSCGVAVAVGTTQAPATLVALDGMKKTRDADAAEVYILVAVEPTQVVVVVAAEPLLALMALNVLRTPGTTVVGDTVVDADVDVAAAEVVADDSTEVASNLWLFLFELKFRGEAFALMVFEC